jgi:serine protease Do
MSGFTVSKRRLTKLAWAVALLLVVLAPILAAAWLPRTSQAAAPAVPAEISGLENFQRGFAWVANTIKPSVVFIEVERKVEAADQAEDSEPDLRDFFGPDFPFPMPSPRQRPQQPSPRIPVGQGSGVVIDPAGYILTNNHVIEEAAKITVHLGNDDSYPAEIVGRDELVDLAVVKIKPKQPLKAAELGDTDKAEVGSWAIAVGYPFGGSRTGGAFDQPLHYEPTITVGVVSALNRQIPSDREGHPFRGLVQTDAPINPGNSGGPLVNIRAQVIGINQAIYTNSPLGGGNIGVGFAIPINARTKRVIETLKGGEKVVRGRLGIVVSPVTETYRKVYGLDHGVLALQVEPGSAADRAGIKMGDVLLEFEGKQVASQDEFVNSVQATKPGTVVDILVLRDDKRVKIKATVEAMPEAEAEKKAAAVEPERLGLTVEELPAEAARKANLEGGVRVKAVDQVSDGARAGVQAGDIIFKINRAQVTDLGSYRKVVGALKAGDPVVLWVWRSGRPLELEIGSLSE